MKKWWILLFLFCGISSVYGSNPEKVDLNKLLKNPAKHIDKKIEIHGTVTARGVMFWVCERIWTLSGPGTVTKVKVLYEGDRAAFTPAMYLLSSCGFYFVQSGKSNLLVKISRGEKLPPLGSTVKVVGKFSKRGLYYLTDSQYKVIGKTDGREHLTDQEFLKKKGLKEFPPKKKVSMSELRVIVLEKIFERTKKFVKRLLPIKEKEEVFQKTGIELVLLESYLRRNILRTKTPYGFKIGRIKKGSPAARAGLKRGDVLHTWDGKPIKSVSQLAQAVRFLKPGSSFQIEYARLKKNRTIWDRSPWEIKKNTIVF